jgi:hypothetical protein
MVLAQQRRQIAFARIFQTGKELRFLEAEMPLKGTAEYAPKLDEKGHRISGWRRRVIREAAQQMAEAIEQPLQPHMLVVQQAINLSAHPQCSVSPAAGPLTLGQQG